MRNQDHKALIHIRHSYSGPRFSEPLWSCSCLDPSRLCLVGGARLFLALSNQSPHSICCTSVRVGCVRRRKSLRLKVPSPGQSIRTGYIGEEFSFTHREHFTQLFSGLCVVCDLWFSLLRGHICIQLAFAFREPSRWKLIVKERGARINVTLVCSWRTSCPTLSPHRRYLWFACWAYSGPPCNHYLCVD